MATRGPGQEDKSDQVVSALEGYERPFMGTGEIADQLGYTSNPGVQKHLERAVEKGKIERASISGYNIWYLPGLARESKIQNTTRGAGGGGPGLEMQPLPEEEGNGNSFPETINSLETVLGRNASPVAALGDITEESDYSRQTVHDRLEEAVGSDLDETGGRDVQRDKVAGANIYWIEYRHSESGRPRKELREEIITTLKTTDHRAMTLGMITEEVSGSRATVKDRLDILVENEVVESDKIGNATSYWFE